MSLPRYAVSANYHGTLDSDVRLWYTPRMFDQPTELQVVTPVTYDAPLVAAEVVDVLPALTVDEDAFCLAVIEYSGNLSAAYKAVFGNESMPLAKARAMMQRPEIIARLQALQDTAQQHVLVSMASHVTELAEIRDLAKINGNLKVALGAERARGEVAGLYVGKIGNAPKAPVGGAQVAVIVNVSTPQDASL